LICRGDLHGFGVAVVRDLQVPLEREYTCWAWHLEYQVVVVGHLHELGDGRSAEDGRVGCFEVRDLELDVSVR
jgi:hypothetical protein